MKEEKKEGRLRRIARNVRGGRISKRWKRRKNIKSGGIRKTEMEEEKKEGRSRRIARGVRGGRISKRVKEEHKERRNRKNTEEQRYGGGKRQEWKR